MPPGNRSTVLLMGICIRNYQASLTNHLSHFHWSDSRLLTETARHRRRKLSDWLTGGNNNRIQLIRVKNGREGASSRATTEALSSRGRVSSRIFILVQISAPRHSTTVPGECGS